MSRVLATFFLLITLVHIVMGYQFNLIERDETFPRCRNQTCEDGERHSLCRSKEPPERNCVGFKMINMTIRRKSILINGHNGIRNKMANEYKISNMLLLHWDRDLAEMAIGFLKRCIIDKDPCNYIYNDTLTVGQTYYFKPKLPLNRFVITIMRHWFLEINEIEDFGQFLKEKPPNMTQMIYPRTEFFGCAAAEMYGGHMMSCCYSPAADMDPKAYIIGKPCKSCPEHRVSCSRLFHGICGLDIPIGEGSAAAILLRFTLLISSILFSTI